MQGSVTAAAGDEVNATDELKCGGADVAEIPGGRGEIERERPGAQDTGNEDGRDGGGAGHDLRKTSNSFFLFSSGASTVFASERESDAKAAAGMLPFHPRAAVGPL